VNDEVHQTIDETGSAIDNERIVDEQSKETVDDGWKRVSRHENARKRLARIGEDKASDWLAQSDDWSLKLIIQSKGK
jgi:hypothetical protein